MSLTWMPVMLVLSTCCLLLAEARGPASGTASRPVTIATLQPRGASKLDPFSKDFDVTKVEPLSEENLENMYALLEEAGRLGADIAFAPEDIQGIASYGLHIKTTDPTTGENLYLSMIQTIPGPITHRLSAIAKKHRMNIVAGMYQKTVEGEGNRYYNAAVVIDREGGIVGVYRKCHLPCFEKWTLSRGTTYPVFQLDCARVGIAICFEIDFPECPRILALRGADIIFNPTLGKAGGERGLIDAYLFRTRAVENSVHIVISEYGSDGSGVIDFAGKVTAERRGEENVVVTATIDLAKERIDPSEWWRQINGTDNVRAMRTLERQPHTYQPLFDPHPPVLDRYKDIKLVTEPEEMDRAYEAVRY